MFDLAVYTPLSKSGSDTLAVLASGVVGAIVDSMLFVYLAFGSFEFSLGTTLAKLYATDCRICHIFIGELKMQIEYTFEAECRCPVDKLPDVYLVTLHNKSESFL
jgi:uncharacterized PurR-regulated membrane protein YhhQ (DUF165 family)